MRPQLGHRELSRQRMVLFRSPSWSMNRPAKSVAAIVTEAEEESVVTVPLSDGTAAP